MIDRIVAEFGQTDAYPVSTPMVENANSFLTRPPADEILSEEEKTSLAKLPYRSLIGQLLYPSLGSRPDISFAVQKLSKFLDCYRRSHWDAAIRIIRYLKGTRELHLWLGGENIDLRGFTDSSWGDCLDGRKSSMGYCYTLGGGLVSWSAKKQKVVATSSTEAEYITASEACKEGLWLRTMLSLMNLPISRKHSQYPQHEKKTKMVSRSTVIIMVLFAWHLTPIPFTFETLRYPLPFHTSVCRRREDIYPTSSNILQPCRHLHKTSFYNTLHTIPRTARTMLRARRSG